MVAPSAARLQEASPDSHGLERERLIDSHHGLDQFLLHNLSPGQRHRARSENTSASLVRIRVGKEPLQERIVEFIALFFYPLVLVHPITCLISQEHQVGTRPYHSPPPYHHAKSTSHLHTPKSRSALASTGGCNNEMKSYVSPRVPLKNLVPGATCSDQSCWARMQPRSASCVYLDTRRS